MDERPLHKVEHLLEGVHHRLEFLAAAEIVRGIWELAERFAGMGEQLETAGVQAGITASEFQRLAFAASQNAVGQDALSAALAKMSRVLQKAKDGSEGAVSTFRKIGITEEQIQGFGNAEDAFLAVEDAISGVDSSTKRLALTQEIFGRGSSKMVKLLGKGSTETKRLMKEADQIGAVVSDAGVEALANFEDAYSGMMQVFRSFLAGIGGMFAPMLTKVIHQVERFWGENQKLIKQDLRRWAGAGAYAFGFLVGVIEYAARAMASLIAKHPEWVDNIAKVVGGLMTLSLATSALSMLLGGVTDAFRAIKGAASLAKPAMLALIWMGRWAGVVLLRVFAALAYGLGEILVTMFPALGTALMTLGEQLLALSLNPFFLRMAGYVGLAVALVAAIHDLWTLMHGGKWEDTWTAKMYEFLKAKGGGAASFFGNLLAGQFGMSAQDGQQMGPPAPGQSQIPYDWAGFAPNAMGLVPTVGTGALQNLAATGMAKTPEGVPSMLARPVENTWNINISAPFNYTGQGGSEEAVKKAAEQAKAALQAAIAEAQRDHAPAALR